MKVVLILFSLLYGCVLGAIRGSLLVNKLTKVKPVGGAASHLPLAEVPSPTSPSIQIIHKDKNGRRHMEQDCSPKPNWREENQGPNVDIIDEYYDEGWAKTVATIIFPAHIDRKHFEVTTQEPYLTVGTIDGIGFHPATVKSEHPSECEKIYQEHMGSLYSDEESAEMSEESLEVARLPFSSADRDTKEIYDDNVGK